MEPALKRMTEDEFLRWREGRQGTWELVDGAPYRKFIGSPEMMAGGTRNHARVATNLLVALSPRLRGGPCEPMGSDMAVRNLMGRIRQPDVVVDCTTGDGHDRATAEPSVVIEVLSPSTRSVDLVLKAEEYRRLPSLAHLVIMEADQARALVWSRDGEGWSVQQVDGLDAHIDLPGIDVSIPMAEAYQRVELSGAD